MSTMHSSLRLAALAALLSPLGACSGEDAPEVMDTDAGIELPTGGQAENDDLDGSGTAADESGGLPGNCGAETFDLVHQPTNVVLVLDKSFSMVDNRWNHDGDGATPDVTRWNSLHSSVSLIVQEFDDGLNFGAVLFPAADVPSNDWEIACEVRSDPDAPVTPMGGEAVLAALPGAEDTELFGGTPASAGVATALDHLATLDDELPQALVLVTDGAANCLEGTAGDAVFDLYDENLPALVAEAYNERDIPTFVVGIDIVDGITDYPQDNPYERLNEVAIAGGFPRPGAEKFHNARDEEQLRAAISQVTSQVGCTIPLDTPPEQPDLLSIVIDGEEIPWIEGGSCEGVDSGWVYVNPEGPYDEIELCGEACVDLHAAGTLAAHYNCIPQA